MARVYGAVQELQRLNDLLGRSGGMHRYGKPWLTGAALVLVGFGVVVACSF